MAAPKLKTTSLPKTRVLKDQMTYEHDLFKLDVATMQANVSFVYLQPILKPAEHCHWFHTVNSKGRPQKYSNAIGGHKHEIKIDWDTGKATCGPAIRENIKRIPNTNRTIRTLGPCAWDSVDMRDGTVKQLVDDHTHEVVYQHSEILSQQKIDEQQRKDRSKAQALISDEKISAKSPDQQLKDGEFSNNQAKDQDDQGDEE